MKKHNAVKFDKTPKAEANNKAQIALQDKSWRYSKLAGLRFLDWLKHTCKDKDMAMKEIYLLKPLLSLINHLYITNYNNH